MASKAGERRLFKEYKSIQQEPVPYIIAKPNEKNILEWHYVITGPPNSPYEGGQYHGTLTFPNDYPFNPPAIRMITPSGRFQPNTRICLSMSDYHPESWNPTWSVATILTGLLSFLNSNENTTGAITSSNQTKITYAKQSRVFNNSASNPKFRQIFPDLYLENAASNRARELNEIKKVVNETFVNNDNNQSNQSNLQKVNKGKGSSNGFLEKNDDATVDKKINQEGKSSLVLPIILLVAISLCMYKILG